MSRSVSAQPARNQSNHKSRRSPKKPSVQLVEFAEDTEKVTTEIVAIFVSSAVH